MNISYSHPLSLGFKRMKKALFEPFDITKWLRIGFTAWLAGFTDCQGGSGGNGGNSGKADWDEFFNFPQTAWGWLADNPLWFNLIIAGVVLLFILGSIFIWLSSRGKFMFLHNVVNDRADISLPWHEYKKEGNSLFIFELLWTWFAFISFIVFATYCFSTGKDLHYNNADNIVIFGAIAQMVLIFFGFIIVYGFISLFLKDFVVPIMYKHRIGVINGWSKFLTLFGKKLIPFILYGLFIFVLGIGVTIAVIFFALLTCCIGLLLIAIPFIGSVILLPIGYTFRAFSIEFLAQFGDDFNLFKPNTQAVINKSGNTKYD